MTDALQHPLAQALGLRRGESSLADFRMQKKPRPWTGALCFPGCSRPGLRAAGEPGVEEVEDVLNLETAGAVEVGRGQAGEPGVEEVEDILGGDRTAGVEVCAAAGGRVARNGQAGDVDRVGVGRLPLGLKSPMTTGELAATFGGWLATKRKL